MTIIPVSAIAGDMPLDTWSRRQITEGFIPAFHPVVMQSARFHVAGYLWEGFLSGIAERRKILTVADPVSEQALSQIVCLNMQGMVDGILRVNPRFAFLIGATNALETRARVRSGDVAPWFRCPNDICRCLGKSP